MSPDMQGFCRFGMSRASAGKVMGNSLSCQHYPQAYH